MTFEKEADLLEALRKSLLYRHITITQKIFNRGTEGIIILGIKRVGEQKVGIKLYHTPISKENLDSLFIEAERLEKNQHDNLVKIFGTGQFKLNENEYFYLVLEYIKGSTLKKLNRKLFLDLKFIKRLDLFIKIIKVAIHFEIHFERHGDLHKGNIIFTAEEDICVIDPLSQIRTDTDRDFFEITVNLSFYFFEESEIQNNGIDKIKDFKTFSEILKFLLDLKLQHEATNEINEKTQIISIQDLLREDFSKLVNIDESEALKEIQMSLGKKLQKFDSFPDDDEKISGFMIKGRNVVALNLPNNDLTFLSTEVFKFLELEFLNLSNNNISIISNIFSKFKNLKKLILRNNKIEKIEIVNFICTNLKHVDLSNNRIKEINTNLPIFQNLYFLNLEKNQINTPPKFIENLKSLKYLNLSYNKISKFPSFIKKNARLESVKLNNNNFDTKQNKKNMNKINKLKSKNLKLSLKDVSENYSFNLIPSKFQTKLNEKSSNYKKLKKIGLEALNNVHDISILCNFKEDEILSFLNSTPTANDKEKLYILKKIDKKKGKRTIFIPCEKLKTAQYHIKKVILSENIIQPSNFAYAFRKGYSIIDNAKNHLSKNILFNLDLKDFFGSITMDKIITIFKDLGYSGRISTILGSLCTYNPDKKKLPFLPQGVQTSPILSNLACINMDGQLNDISKKFKFTYTRYADDISFSSNKQKILPNKFKREIYKTLNLNGFKINWRKHKIAFSHNRQIVTGIIVNDAELRLPRKWLNNLRRKLFELDKKISDPDEREKAIKQLQGMCSYASMINREIYSKFKERLQNIKSITL